LVDGDTSYKRKINQLTGGDNGRAAILGVTISRQGGDIKPDEISRVVALFRRMHDEKIISAGGAATERGGKKGNLHLQCCFWLQSMNRNAADVQTAVSSLVCEFAEFIGSDRHVYAVVHEPENEPNVSWRTQCGYGHLASKLVQITHNTSIVKYRISRPVFPPVINKSMHHNTSKICVDTS
jgi:hypothetical protein